MSNNAELKGARYEVKFVTSEEQLYVLLKWIRLHASRFIIAYNDRWVNNIYFDKYNYFAYTENLSGVSTRHKVRYRWYGKSELPDVGKMEIKCRRNVFGWKKVFEIRNLSTFDKSNRLLNDFKKSLLCNLKKEERIWLDNNPHPVILNRYKRKYFVSGDGKVRITVDTNLTIYDQRYKPYINTIARANIPQTIIVEVKCNREDRELLSQVIGSMPIRVSRNSKYVNAITCINTY